MSNQFDIVIINHGEFGKALVKSAELIVGPIDNIYVFSLLEKMSLETLIQEVEDCIKKLTEDVIILTDLNGGTPNNAATYLQNKFSCGIVTGMNLPMLLELLMLQNQKQESCKSLTEIAESVGKFGIVGFPST